MLVFNPVYSQNLKPYKDPKTNLFCYTDTQQEYLNLTLRNGVVCVVEVNKCLSENHRLKTQLNKPCKAKEIVKTQTIEKETISKPKLITIISGTFLTALAIGLSF